MHYTNSTSIPSHCRPYVVPELDTIPKEILSISLLKHIK